MPFVTDGRVDCLDLCSRFGAVLVQFSACFGAISVNISMFWPVFQGAARAYLAASPLQGSGSFPRCYFGVLQYAYYPIALSFQGPLISFIGQMFDIQAAALDGVIIRQMDIYYFVPYWILVHCLPSWRCFALVLPPWWRFVASMGLILVFS